MNADEILKRDAELRAVARAADKLPPDVGDARWYLASIAAAERALIEAVGAWIVADQMIDDLAPVNQAADRIADAYRALLAAMEEAQR